MSDPSTDPTADLTAEVAAVQMTRMRRRADQAAMMSAVPVPSDDRPDSPVTVSATTVGVGVLASAALALGAAGGTVALAAVLACCGVLLAWGWPILMDLPHREGSSAVLGVGVVAIGVVTFLAPRAEGLRWLIVALAVSLTATFLNELLRSDGRPHLVRSIAGSVFGLAVLAVGAFHIDALVAFDGRVATYAAAAGVAVGLIIDVTVGRTRLGEWCLPIGMVAAAAVGTVIGVAAGVTWSVPMIAALASCGIAHALRRVTTPLPRAGETPAAVAIGVASVLFVGVVPYTALWLLAR